jgi:sulfur-carrier protein
MAIKLRVPPGMRALTDNQALIEAHGVSIREVITNLETTFPGLRARLLDDQGRKRKFINIYLNGEDIRTLQMETTAVQHNDEVDIVAAVAGG